MDCCRLENALGVFLPNGKAAGDSGGLCQLSTVSGRLTPNAGHLPLNISALWAAGAGSPAWSPYGIAMDRWIFVHFAGRPACGPYGIAMGRWIFVHFAGRPACGPYGIAMGRWISAIPLCTLRPSLCTGFPGIQKQPSFGESRFGVSWGHQKVTVSSDHRVRACLPNNAPASDFLSFRS